MFIQYHTLIGLKTDEDNAPFNRDNTYEHTNRVTLK